jgi:spore coat polysaccharide biosynthesis predicted glycosyltransferase SpsG
MECDWLFCCDGDGRSGLGHVGRCLGYAEMLADGGFRSAFCGTYGSIAQEMIRAAGFSYQSRSVEEGWNRVSQPALGIVLDSYLLDARSISEVRASMAGKRLLVMDDFAAHSRYDCDGIINFTIGSTQCVYPKGSAQLYLGPEYFPARRWLRRLRDTHVWSDRVEKVLVIPGGSDRTGVTHEILSCLIELKMPLEVEVMVPEERIGDGDLLALVKPFQTGKLSSLKTSLERSMYGCDVCVCGGGLTKYECLYAGIPVASLAQTEAQQEDSVKLSAHGWIADMGSMAQPDHFRALAVLRRFLSDVAWRREMRQAGFAAMGSIDSAICLKPFS